MSKIIAKGTVSPEKVTCAFLNDEGYSPAFELDPDLGIYAAIEDALGFVDDVESSILFTPDGTGGYEWTAFSD